MNTQIAHIAVEPLVSVIMSIYYGNTVEEVHRSLESLMVQDYPNIEIVLVVDGPISEGVYQLIQTLQMKGQFALRPVLLKKNVGLGPALNAAIAFAEGMFLARMDADDVSLPDRFRTQVNYLLAHPEIDVVGCLMEEVMYDGTRHKTEMPLTPNECVKEFARRDPIHHPTAMFRRCFFDKAGEYPNYDGHEDGAMWLAAMKAGCNFANIPEVMYRMFLDKHFFLRRRSFRLIWAGFKLRLRIAHQLGYGMRGYIWSCLRMGAMLLPRPLLRQAYTIRNAIWKDLAP